MEDNILSVKDHEPKIIFLQDFRAACDTCKLLGGAALYIFKHHVNGLIESVVKDPVDLAMNTAEK